jgi:hypothetical protein
MTRPARESWTIRFSVPVSRHSGRYFASFLKALGRRWGIIAEQIVEAPPEAAPPAATALGPAFGVKVARAEVEEIAARLEEQKENGNHET